MVLKLKPSASMEFVGAARGRPVRDWVILLADWLRNRTYSGAGALSTAVRFSNRLAIPYSHDLTG